MGIIWPFNEYDFLGVSLSDAKCMGEEYSNESRNAFY